MKKVEMPKMGDTMESGKILHWIRKEGDAVKKGESLAEVETDKVNIEIEAFASGVLRKILVAEGDSAPIGAPIALIGAPDEPLPDDIDRTTGNGPTTPRQGDRQSRPYMSEMYGRGLPPPWLEKAATTGEAPAQPPTAPGPATLTSRIFISPIARRLAEEHRLDYSGVRGTGPNGRIIKMDIEAALTQLSRTGASPAPTLAGRGDTVPRTASTGGRPVSPAAPTPVSQPIPEPEFVPAAAQAGDVVEIPLTTMRRTIARRLSQSMQSAPHFYMTSVIDTGKLAALRQQINEYAAHDPSPVKVSFNDLIIKAIARALVHMPQVNVSFAEDRILQKKQVHIGVAVALDEGLIVPVLHHADQRGILDIARETKRLAEAARGGTLRPEDLSGGTFTVSNLGMFDVDSFTAVINPPESAILAIGSITPTPVVVDGQVVVRDRMKVTLSSDHRAIDGATAARFLQEIKRLLEEPMGLLL